MFGADVRVAQGAGFLERQLEHPLAAGGEGDFARLAAAVHHKVVLERAQQLVNINTQPRQHSDREALVVLKQGVENVFRIHEAVAEFFGFGLGRGNDFLGVFRKFVPHN